MKQRAPLGTWFIRWLLLLGLAGPAVAVAQTVQDEFNNSNLSPAWSVWDGYALQRPSDTANHAQFRMTGSQLSIAIPGGQEHNMWWLKHAQVARAYEGSGVYEIKVDSSLTGAQQVGLSFQNDPGTFMIFMLYATDQVRAYIERFAQVDGQQYKTTVAGKTLGLSVPSAGPYYLRVTVQDNADPSKRSWKFDWSYNGLDWTNIFAGAYETTSSSQNVGVIREFGIFAGNQPTTFDAFDARIDYFRFYSEVDGVPMPAPANLTARGGNQRVELWWDAIEGADSYAVYRSSLSGGPFQRLLVTSGTSHLDEAVTNGSRYFYAVEALRGSAAGDRSAAVSAVPHVVAGMQDLPQQGLVLSLNADDLALTLADGEPVLSWPNAIGPRIAAGSAGNQAPRLVKSGLNGRALVRFDGADDFLSLPSGFQDFTAGMSLYLVVRPTILKSGFKYFLLGNGANKQNLGFGRAGTTAGYQYFTSNSAGSVTWFNTSEGLTAGEPALLSVHQESGPANGLSFAEVARDGTPIFGKNVYVPPVAVRSLNYIGKSYWNDGLFQGDVAEVLLYNRILTYQERAAVHSYVSQKYSLTISGITPPPPPPPPPLDAPGGVAATGGDSTVSLSWSAVSGASGYRLLRSEVSGGPYLQIADLAGIGTADTAVVNGTTYYYVVRAYDASRESANSAQVSATPQALPPPPPSPPLEAPASVAATAGDGTVALSWSAVSSATGYRVLRGDVSGGPYNQVASVATTRVSDTGLVNGATYYYVVRAYDSTRESSNSVQVAATPTARPPPPPPPPAEVPTAGLVLALDATALAQQLPLGSAVTSWTDSSGQGNTAVAGSGAPTLVANAIGGRPAVRFDGIDDFLVLPAGFSDFTGGMSLYIVVRPTVLTAGFKMLLLGNGTNKQNIGFGRGGSTEGLQYFTFNNSGGVTWFNTTDGLVAGEAAMFSVVQAAGAANGTSYGEVGKNGTALFGKSMYVPPVTTRSVNYIGKSSWTSDGMLRGDVAEVLLYNRALNTTEQASLRAYIAQKYGLPVQ